MIAPTTYQRHVTTLRSDMARFDFVGAPGTGKSTLISAVLSKTDSKSFVSARSGFIRATCSEESVPLKARVLLRVLPESLAYLIAQHLVARRADKAVSLRLSEYLPALEFLLKLGAPRTGDYAYATRAISNLFLQLRETAFVECVRNDLVVLCDESLTKRANYFSSYQSLGDVSLAIQWLWCVPPADGVIVMTCDRQTAVARLRAREFQTRQSLGDQRTHPEQSSTEIIASGIEIADCVQAIMRAREIPVVEVNCHDNQDTQLKTVFSFLEQNLA